MSYSLKYRAEIKKTKIDFTGVHIVSIFVFRRPKRNKKGEFRRKPLAIVLRLRHRLRVYYGGKSYRWLKTFLEQYNKKSHYIAMFAYFKMESSLPTLLHKFGLLDTPFQLKQYLFSKKISFNKKVVKTMYAHVKIGDLVAFESNNNKQGYALLKGIKKKLLLLLTYIVLRQFKLKFRNRMDARRLLIKRASKKRFWRFPPKKYQRRVFYNGEKRLLSVKFVVLPKFPSRKRPKYYLKFTVFEQLSRVERRIFKMFSKMNIAKTNDISKIIKMHTSRMKHRYIKLQKFMRKKKKKLRVSFIKSKIVVATTNFMQNKGVNVDNYVEYSYRLLKSAQIYMPAMQEISLTQNLRVAAFDSIRNTSYTG